METEVCVYSHGVKSRTDLMSVVLVKSGNVTCGYKSTNLNCLIYSHEPQTNLDETAVTIQSC